MARKHYTTEQMICLLREAEFRLGEGEAIEGSNPDSTCIRSNVFCAMAASMADWS